MLQCHVSTTYAHQTFIFSAVAPIIVRSVIGPIIPGSLILVIVYIRNGSILVTVLTLGYGALVRLGFLISFSRMSEVSEKIVKRLMYCLCLAWVLAAVAYTALTTSDHNSSQSSVLPGVSLRIRSKPILKRFCLPAYRQPG